MESFLACSIKPQVFIKTRSVASPSETKFQPSADNLPANSSESTSFREQPRETIETRGLAVTL